MYSRTGVGPVDPVDALHKYTIVRPISGTNTTQCQQCDLEIGLTQVRLRQQTFLAAYTFATTHCML